MSITTEEDLRVVKPGERVSARFGSRVAPLIYWGRCWNTRCRRPLFESITGNVDSESIPLGVNVYDGWDNTSIVAPPGVDVDYPVCFECKSDRNVYRAVCRDVQNRRSFRRTSKALAKYDANAPTLTDWEQVRTPDDVARLEAREARLAHHVAIAYWHDTRDINAKDRVLLLKPGPKVPPPGQETTLIRRMVEAWEARQ